MMASKYIQPIFIIFLGGIITGVILLGCRQEPAPTPITESSVEPDVDTQPDTSTSTSTPAPSPPTDTAALSSTLPVTNTPASPAVSPTPTALSLPALITEIPLAPEDEQITAMLLEAKANRLYVTDSSGQLHILDTESYDVLQTMPVAPDYTPRLTLAADQNKLFATADQFSTVVDTRQLTITHVISPGGHIALDTARNRFFIGSPWGDRPVRVYDLDDLSLIGTLVQTGTPVYNPAREELYLLSRHLQAIDLKNLDRIEVPLDRELLAPIGFYSDLHFLPHSNSLIVDVLDYFSISGRPASAHYYSFFAADTLSEITDPNALPHTEFSCLGGLIVPETIPGLRLHYDPFESYRFQVEDEETGQRTWYEGVKLGRTNARTGQLYFNSMVFDLAEVKPLGLLPVPACIERVEPETGRLFGVRKGTLVIFAETGGGPLDLSPLLVDTLPRNLEIADATQPAIVTNLKFSPTYSQDQTIIVDGNQLYRSTDGGQSWVQLRGGLPVPHDSINLTVTFSPNFAHDRTLFATQNRLNQEISFGLYHSVDGGDTWQPLNDGLTRLGVYQVDVSPDFSLDNTLLIKSSYNALAEKYLGPFAYHYSTLLSTDRGQSWTQVVTRTDRIGVPVPPLPLTASPATHFRWVDHNWTVTIQRSQDGGLTWVDVFTLPDYADPTERPPDRQVISVSPNFALDPTVFIHLQDKIYRSVDAGESWEVVSFADWPLSLTLSPNFAVDQTVYGYDGSEFYRSTDKGATWVSITPACPPDSDPCSFSPLIFSPHFGKNRLMLTRLGSHIFSTTDDGDAWRPAALPVTDTGFDYIRDIIFSPDPDTLFALYGHWLFRSVDQGRTWIAALPYTAPILYFSPTYSDDQTLYFLQQDFLGYTSSTGDFLFRSTDGGETWRQWNAAENLLNSGSDTFIDKFLISPPDQQGQHHLFFIMTTPTKRQIIRLDPAELAWGPVIEPTPTPSPTPLPQPTATSAAATGIVVATPPPGPTATTRPTFPVAPRYAQIWAQLGGETGALGPALAPAVEDGYAFQPFAGGWLHWGWQDGGETYIHILSYGANDNTGQWSRQPDLWQAGQAEYLCAEAVPPFGPRRGFGRVWCDCETCRTALGNPLAEEQGASGGYQTFAGGVMLWHPAEEKVYVLFDNGEWQSF